MPSPPRAEITLIGLSQFLGPLLLEGTVEADHLCPSTSKTRRACLGYVVDHIKPLCVGGADRPSNMQWQTREEAKIKDRREREMCRDYRR